MAKVDLDDLCGTKEIALMLGVVPSAVSNWKRRYPDFPDPIAAINLGHTQIYSRRAVVRWWMKRADPRLIDAIQREAQNVANLVKGES